MNPEIVSFEGALLGGVSVETSFSNNLTSKLWSQFMPRRTEIKSGNEDLYSVAIYHDGPPSPSSKFTKWAAKKINNKEEIPEGMSMLTIESGLYARFPYKGKVSDFPETMTKFYTSWLPSSGYQIDSRPHFEVLGSKYYGPENPDSEEMIYVPLKRSKKS